MPSDHRTGSQAGQSATPAEKSTHRPHRLTRVVELSGFFHLSGVYVLALLVLVFARLDHPYFLTVPTLKNILATSAIGGIVAIGAVVPFSAGLLDIQFGNIAGFALVMMTWLSTSTHLNDGLLAIITVVAGAAFGLASGLIVSVLRVNSLVVTLGMGTMALGLCYLAISARTVEANLAPWFTGIGRSQLGPIPVPVIALAVLAAVLYVWLEHTPSGREIRLIGSNAEAARMAGINVRLAQTLALTVSSLIAGVAGVIWCAQIGFGNSTNGANLLFPAISAVMLGSTQVRHRVNVFGTVIAVLIIQTGVVGLDLHEGGTAAWPSSAFSGVLLLAAISIVAWNGRRRIRSQRRAALRAQQAR